MKKLADEILKGKNLQENLSVFAHQMMAVYNDYSYIRLSMNYYTYYDIIRENNRKDDNLQGILDDFNQIVKEGIIENISGSDWEAMLEKADALRNRVIDIMKGLTSYVDIFNLYEYCLNRVEYNFTEPDDNLEIGDEKLAANVLKYIVSQNDNVVINSKIAEVVRQIPVRMTKSKFFEYLREGIKVYKGSEISSVEDFLYMLKTSAAVEISPCIDLLSDDIKAVYNEFKKVKFDDLDTDRYYDLKNKLDFATAYLGETVSLYMSLGELINDVYVILLSSPYCLTESSDYNLCSSIIKQINSLFNDNEMDDLYDRIAEEFVKLEGRQEALHQKYSSYEYVIDQVVSENSDILQSLMLKKIYDSLKMIEVLESGSIFVEFSETNKNIADEKYIDKITDELIENILDIFSSSERIVKRAMMASMLSSIPVFFKNVDEIKDYVLNGLSQCRDNAEKMAVTEILKQMMDEDGYEMV